MGKFQYSTFFWYSFQHIRACVLCDIKLPYLYDSKPIPTLPNLKVHSIANPAGFLYKVNKELRRYELWRTLLIGKEKIVSFLIKLRNKVIIQNEGKQLYQSTKAKIGKSGNALLIRWRRNLHLQFSFRHYSTHQKGKTTIYDMVCYQIW
jgi:hypothetical protein